jgi:hypothetical protein
MKKLILLITLIMAFTNCKSQITYYRIDVESFGQKSYDPRYSVNYGREGMCGSIREKKDTLYVTDSLLQEVYVTFAVQAKSNAFFCFFQQSYQNASFSNPDSLIVVSIFDPSIKLFSLTKKGITILNEFLEIEILDSSANSYRYSFKNDELKYEEKYTVKVSNFPFVKTYINIFPCE